MLQRYNSVLKGTIEYAKTVSLNLADFADLPKGQLLPVRMTISVTVMNGPSYLAISQWDGNNDNSYFCVINRLINPRQTFTKTFLWPPSVFAINTATSMQALCVINHCAGGDVYGSDKPIMFYMANLTVLQAADQLDSTVDPPHQNIKHGESRFSHLTLEDM